MAFAPQLATVEIERGDAHEAKQPFRRELAHLRQSRQSGGGYDSPDSRHTGQPLVALLAGLIGLTESVDLLVERFDALLKPVNVRINIDLGRAVAHTVATMRLTIEPLYHTTWNVLKRE